MDSRCDDGRIPCPLIVVVAMVIGSIVNGSFLEGFLLCDR